MLRHGWIVWLALVATIVSASPAHAQRGDWTGSFGLVWASIDAESAEVGDTGTAIGFDDSVAFMIGFAWMATDTLSLETTLTVGALDIGTRNGLYPDVDLGEMWTSWTTFGLQYHIPLYGPVNPVIGGGAALVWPFSDSISSNGFPIGVGSLETGARLGWTANAGVIWDASSKWAWRADIRYLAADLELDVINPNNDLAATVDMPFSAVTLTLGASWRF